MSEQDQQDGTGTSAQAPATGGPGTAAAGVPAGGAPSGATEPGTVPEDARDEQVPGTGESGPAAVPGQVPGAASPVPAPGAAPGTTTPGVQATQGASPADGIHAGDKAEDSDASVTSPGAWTALAVPGKPDGEVDTRSR